MARRFYRIVRANPPTLRDFTSNAGLDRPPPNQTAETPCLWSGPWLQATQAQARNRAHDLPRLGRHIARLDIPEGGSITWEETLGRGHYTLWGPAAEIARCLVDVVPVERVG